MVEAWRAAQMGSSGGVSVRYVALETRVDTVSPCPTYY